MRAAVVLCFILALSSLILISLRGGGLCTCTSLPTDNDNIHYNSTLTPADRGFSPVKSGMAAELSGCSKSIIGDDRHDIDTQRSSQPTTRLWTTAAEGTGGRRRTVAGRALRMQTAWW